MSMITVIFSISYYYITRELLKYITKKYYNLELKDFSTHNTLLDTIMKYFPLLVVLAFIFYYITHLWILGACIIIYNIMMFPCKFLLILHHLKRRARK